jgi:hypothetical protein
MASATKIANIIMRATIRVGFLNKTLHVDPGFVTSGHSPYTAQAKAMIMLINAIGVCAISARNFSPSAETGNIR